MNAPTYAPKSVTRAHAYSTEGAPGPAMNTPGLSGPIAGVVSRTDGVIGMVHKAAERVRETRERLSSIAAQLHGPRPEQAKSNEPPQGGNPSTMNNLEEAARILHAQLDALEEAVSAL